MIVLLGTISKIATVLDQEHGPTDYLYNSAVFNGYSMF